MIVQRVIETLVAHGLPEPIIDTIKGGMAVTVFKQTDKPENTFGHKMQQDGGVSEGVRTLLAIVFQINNFQTA